MSKRLIAALLFTLLAVAPMAFAQSVTGQISGTVTDASGAIVTGAAVKLTHDLSQQTRQFTTDGNGSFSFFGLVPGAYTLNIAQPGFRAYDQKGIVVAAQERLDLHEIKLSVGDVTTSIAVEANAVHVATDSSDRSVAIGLKQIEDTPTRGRNPLGLIMTLPGVQTLASNDFRGWSGGGIPAINGGQTGQVILNLDGAASQDSGNLNPGYIAPSVDAIGEVRLLVSNYTAEYGGRTGGQLTFTTKSGSSQFHGTAYYYLRHEQFNANEWFNNKLRTEKPRYRYQNPGGTIGGPLIIPGTNFNKSRTKLFFFFSMDYLRNKNTINNTFTMPTALERAGDFSQTTTTQGVLIPIFDPRTQTAFPGNRVPANMINRTGLAMLNLFPQPDPLGLRLDPTYVTNPTTGLIGGRFNYRAILPQLRPNEDKILRLDYNIRAKDQFFARLLQDYQAVDGYAGTVGPAGGAWGQFPHSYHVQAVGAVGTWVHTFSPNLIMEASYGVTRGKQGVNPLDTVDSTAVGGTKTYEDNLLPLKDAQGAIPLPRIFPSSNSQNLLPQVRFDLPAGFNAQSAGQGITGAPNFGHDPRWPFVGTDMLQSYNAKLTWVKGAHNVKGGMYIERMARNVSVYSVYNTAGSYYFGSDRAAALDTGYPISNALLGSIFGYGDDNKKQENHARYTQFEWFVQDTWKVSRRLTLDLGARFHRVGDLYSKGATLGFFRQEEYDRNKSGQLLFPGCSVPTAGTCATANRIAVNPRSGAQFPYVRQGTFDTASYTGLPFSGIHEYNSHFFNTPPIRVGPRVGFAWDVFGDGKTAVRGGFGITVGRNWTVDNIGATGAGTGPMAAPPNFQAPTILYTSFASLAGAQPYYTPQNVLGGSQDEETQTTYNWSFGVQRELTRGLVLDVSYVANALRHGYGQGIDYNAVAPYTTWTPTGGVNNAFRDPTSAGFYSTNLIRSMVGYSGYGQIPIWTYKGTSNYHALQVQVNRRVGRLQWNWNYTFSRTTTYDTGTGAQWVDTKLTKNITNRPHAVNFNMGYDLPDFARVWNNAFSRHALNGWKINGNGTIYSGTPFTVGCGATNAPPGYWTGTPTGGIPFRCQMGNEIFRTDGKLNLATEDPQLQWNLNPANFLLPGPNTLGIGNTPPSMFYGPGVFNLDMSLGKNFRLAEGKTLEFRWETFNTLNHFNPGNPNTGLTYNCNNNCQAPNLQQTNNNFGVITGAQVQARRSVMSLRLRF